MNADTVSYLNSNRIKVDFLEHVIMWRSFNVVVLEHL